MIFAHNVPQWLGIRDGISVFKDLKCPVNKCRWTTRKDERKTADLVIFILEYVPGDSPRPKNQIYALYLSESPPHTSSLSRAGKFIQIPLRFFYMCME